MAEIVNEDGTAQLKASIEVLDSVRGGMVSHGSAFLNAMMGVVRARVSFWIGDRAFVTREVYLHQMSVRSWAKQVSALVQGELDRDEIAWGAESPELLINLRRFDVGDHARYEMTIALDVSALADEGVTGEGPGLLLMPEAEAVVQFADDLLAETAACL